MGQSLVFGLSHLLSEQGAYIRRCRYADEHAPQNSQDDGAQPGPDNA